MRSLVMWFMVALAGSLALLGCNEANVASRNLSYEADRFNVERRVVFYNGITGAYILVIEGRCSLGNMDKPRELTVTCKTGESAYKKHFLGISDNVTFFLEQVEPKAVSGWHYKVEFKPQTIIPDIDFAGSGKALQKLP